MFNHKPDTKEDFARIFETMKPELNDEQKQTDLMQMIEMDKEEIKDCLQFLGMSEDKWEQMWGKKK